MTCTDLQCAMPTIVVATCAAAIGAIAGGQLVKTGLGQLEVVPTRRAYNLGRCACGLAGPAAVLAARSAGSWWLVPAMLVLAYCLGALATCDAVVLRIPTPFVRLTAVLVGVFVIGAAAANGHWQWAASAGLSAVAAGLVLAVCWRFIGMGFGDVRLAALGGLGIVDPTRVAVAAGALAFVLITLVQAGITLARGGDRHTMLPYGPAIAIAFMVVALV